MSDLIERLLANGLDECDEAAALIRTLDAELAALREARGVRVKPLVWVVGSNEVHAFARSETDLGLYQILSVPTDSDHRLLLPNGDYKHFTSYTSAKAAAQADYERRILAALEPALAKLTADTTPAPEVSVGVLLRKGVGREAIDAAFKSLPADAYGTIAEGEMERVILAALRALAGDTDHD